MKPNGILGHIFILWSHRQLLKLWILCLLSDDNKSKYFEEEDQPGSDTQLTKNQMCKRETS